MLYENKAHVDLSNTVEEEIKLLKRTLRDVRKAKGGKECKYKAELFYC